MVFHGVTTSSPGTLQRPHPPDRRHSAAIAGLRGLLCLQLGKHPADPYV
jgi:hypothetical protein